MCVCLPLEVVNIICAAQPASVAPFSVKIHYHRLIIVLILYNGTPETPVNRCVREERAHVPLLNVTLIVGMNQMVSKGPVDKKT